jgi:heavy metal efflux system protein
VQSIVNELQIKIGKQLKFPIGYYVTYGGAFENLNAAKQRLMIAVPVSLLLIFLLLYFAFNSIKHGLLIYSAIPLSAIGGILFLALRGMPFSISAGVGFIALFGVAVLNGIVLIAEFNRLKSEGLTDLKRIVLMGTKVRLRPVLMTAFVASLGFFPMAVSNGAGAEVQRPLATVVIGGLLIATFLTLFVLPVLYMSFEKGFKKNKKMEKPITTAIVLFCLSISNVSFAQQSITLNAAIDTAIKNNAQLKNEQLKTQYQQMLLKTVNTIPRTNVVAEAGQINSIYNDTKFGISQSFSFPKVYKTQKELYNQEWKSSLLNVDVKRVFLKKQVAQIFYNAIYLQQKKQLLQSSDSLFTAFYKKAALRLSKGESNVLEKASAETQLGQIIVQLNQLEQDEKMLQIQFQLLLNSNTVFTPNTETNKATIDLLADTALLKQHPEIKIIQQQQNIAVANIAVEKSKLMPDMLLGLSNTSIKGTGADNNLYSSSQRFSSVQVGIGIPIFTKAQKAKINSAKFSKQIAENEYSVAIQKLQSEYEWAFAQYNKHLQTVQYFETKGLQNAELVSSTANKQLANGIINYLEWTQLINQVTIVKNEYIDAVKNLNEAIVQLNYFSNK